MLIRILKAGQGCVFQPGQLIRTSDRQAQDLITQGFAEAEGELEKSQIPTLNKSSFRGRNPVQKVRPSTHMLPPRYIAPDGRVFKNQKELDDYLRDF